MYYHIKDEMTEIDRFSEILEFPEEEKIGRFPSSNTSSEPTLLN